MILSRRMGPRGHGFRDDRGLRANRQCESRTDSWGFSQFLAARGWLALVHVRPYMTMYVQGHVDIGKKVPLCKAASRKPQVAFPGTREKRPSPPGSFLHLVELRKGRACTRTRLPIERGAVDP